MTVPAGPDTLFEHLKEARHCTGCCAKLAQIASLKKNFLELGRTQWLDCKDLLQQFRCGSCKESPQCLQSTPGGS